MARKPAQKSKKIESSRKRAKNWKKELLSKRKSKKIKEAAYRYVAICLLFITSITFLAGYLGIKKLTSPFVSAQSTSSYDIRGEDIFTIAFYEVSDLENKETELNKVKVYIYDTKGPQLLELQFDTETELDVSGKYSTEPVHKILRLSTLVHNGNIEDGIVMTNKTLGRYLGFNIDKYVVVDSSTSDSIERLLSADGFITNFNYDFSTFSTSFISNMSMSELYYIHSISSKLNETSKKNIAVTSNTTHSDINNSIRNLTFDSNIALEKASVAILNGTNHAGAASFGARVVNNLGGRVVRVDNASQKYEHSILIVDDPNSYTTRGLSKFFDEVTIMSKEEASDLTDNELVRADVILIVGIDIVSVL